MKNKKELDPNSYEALKKSSSEACDFCDGVFNNRYDSAIHNSSHIIIPLLKQNLFLCEKCPLFFASQDDLIAHKSQHLDNINKIKINGAASKNNEKLNSVKVKIEPHENIKVNGCTEVSIKNELKLQDDFNSNGILKDLITECQVNVQLFNTWDTNLVIKQETLNYSDESTESGNYVKTKKNGCNESNEKLMKVTKSNGEIEKNSMKFNDKLVHLTEDDGIEKKNVKLNNKVKEKKKNDVHDEVIRKKIVDKLVFEDEEIDEYAYDNFVTDEIKYESVHYSCLVKPGIFNCRYCYISYPNRFTLIQHEVTHMTMKKSRPLLCQFCDRFIAGNYRNLHSHIEKLHSDSKMTTDKTYKCDKCGLKYRKYRRHAKNYHPDEVMPKYDKSLKILKVCEFCFSFFKHKINLKYILMGNTDPEMGVRHTCEVCRKLFFELKIVKRICSSRCAMKERKKMTNEDRLKNIQQRLKKLNLLNRFYFVVLFISQFVIRLFQFQSPNQSGFNKF